MNYQEFLKTKELQTIQAGFDVDKEELNSNMFDFQKDITAWALKKGKCAILIGCGCGKGQPYGSKVLTDNGWVEIQNLKVGNKVLSSDGKFYPVVGVYPKDEIDTYRFYYTDNTSLVFDKDHLHITRTQHERQRKQPWRVMSTTELLECGNFRYGKNGRSRNYDIPIVKPIEYPKKDYMISPYVIGVLIGDGYIKGNVGISNPDKEIIERVQKELPSNIILERSKYCEEREIADWFIKTGSSGNKKHPFREELNRIGLLNKLSYEKFIPDEYKTGSIEQRLDLLRGLMDTDGYSGGCQVYYTTSERLKDDVIDLIRSLGGIPKCYVKQGNYKKNGKIKKCKDCYSISFSLNTFNPFYLKRKADKWNPKPRGNGKWIDRIEYECKQKTVCISVDSPDHSYITENYTVTHNTVIQLEWANQIYKRHKKNVLIVAPLSVVKQTTREAEKFNVETPVTICRTQEDVKDGINITNYEMAEHFDADSFIAVVLDESSILKSFTSQTTIEFTKKFARLPYKLLCTATIAPNDQVEIGTSSEFLGIMSRTEMLATYFVHDGGKTSEWRLKKAAVNKFWEWFATWAICFNNPNELDYKIDGYDLPKLNMQTIILKSEIGEYEMFAKVAETLQERREARKESMEDRTDKARELTETDNSQWLLWVDYNDESTLLHKKIIDSVEVKGSDEPEFKANSSIEFANGKIRVLVSKPSIFGFGSNFQSCHNMIFCGLSDSYERFYQAVRRCWRFGQTEEVNCYIILSEKEIAILENIKRKQKLMDEMQTQMTALMKEVTLSEIQHTTRITTKYEGISNIQIPTWLRSE